MMTRIGQTIALGMLVSMVAGCGAPAVTAVKPASTSVTAAAARVAPPAVSQGTAVTADDYSLIVRTHQIASDTLYRYEDLRRLWYATPGDEQKDRVELQMADVLTQGLRDVRRVSSSSYGYDADRMYRMADRGLMRYDELRRDYELAWGDRDRRVIMNRILTELTELVKQIRDTRATA